MAALHAFAVRKRNNYVILTRPKYNMYKFEMNFCKLNVKYFSDFPPRTGSYV